MADGFYIIHHLLKQEFNIRLKVLFTPPLPAKVLVKSIAEYGRDELLDVEMFIKEMEERRGIINKYVLTV